MRSGILPTFESFYSSSGGSLVVLLYLQISGKIFYNSLIILETSQFPLGFAGLNIP